jgi:hypothetical protein
MKNKTIWIVVVVLLAIAGFYWSKSGGSLSNLALHSASPSVSATPSASSTVKPSGAKTTAAPVSAKTYTQLAAEYVNRSVQFDASCQATPSSFVLKNNTSILLDNRANVARKITVDGKAYNLAAYGYQVITLSSPSLPHTVNISCGSSVNVSTILLQANISGQ